MSPIRKQAHTRPISVLGIVASKEFARGFDEARNPGTFVVVCNVCGCGWYVLFDQTAESKRVALRLLNRHYDKHTRNIDCSK